MTSSSKPLVLLNGGSGFTGATSSISAQIDCRGGEIAHDYHEGVRRGLGDSSEFGSIFLFHAQGQVGDCDERVDLIEKGSCKVSRQNGAIAANGKTPKPWSGSRKLVDSVYQLVASASC
jgi:hypothetical protein